MGVQYRPGLFGGNLEGGLEGTLTSSVTSCRALNVCCVRGTGWAQGTPAAGSEARPVRTGRETAGGGAGGRCLECLQGTVSCPRIRRDPSSPSGSWGSSERGWGSGSICLFAPCQPGTGRPGPASSGVSWCSDARARRHLPLHEDGTWGLRAVTGVPATRRWGVPAPVTWPAGLRLGRPSLGPQPGLPCFRASKPLSLCESVSSVPSASMKPPHGHLGPCSALACTSFRPVGAPAPSAVSVRTAEVSGHFLISAAPALGT